MGRNDTFSPVIWKTSEIKRKISKSAELFALDYGAGQLVYLKDLHIRSFLFKTYYIDTTN